MPALTDPLTALNLVLIAAVGVALLLTRSPRRRDQAEITSKLKGRSKV